MRSVGFDIFLLGDVRLPKNSAFIGGLLDRDAKTGMRKFVPLRNVKLLALLELRKIQCSPRGKFCPVSVDCFRPAFHEVLGRLGCGDIGFVPHSLRHGGATLDFMTGV